MIWRVLSQGGFGSGINSSPEGGDRLSILGTQLDSENPDKWSEAFGCCCGGGDCILSISVIDEDTTIGHRDPDVRDAWWVTFRRFFPERNFVLLRPQDPPASYCSLNVSDCSIYTAAQWRQNLAQGSPVRFGPLVLPDGWDDTTNVDGKTITGNSYVATVGREDRPNGVVSNWYQILLDLGVIDPNGSGTRIVSRNFGKIAIFLDNSGSMRTSTVREAYELFKELIESNLDISIDNDRLVERAGSNELWIQPHALERPDEDCVNQNPSTQN